MNYKKEKEMYPDVKNWLQRTLEEKYPKSRVYCYDTSQVYLNKFLSENKFKNFKDSITYEIKVDITAIIDFTKKSELVFVECKSGNITLKDISQLLGYSKVAKPIHSLIISQKGVSDPVKKLFTVYKRYDVLEYENNRRILIAPWIYEKNEIDYSRIIPTGYHL